MKENRGIELFRMREAVRILIKFVLPKKGMHHARNVASIGSCYQRISFLTGGGK